MKLEARGSRLGEKKKETRRDTAVAIKALAIEFHIYIKFNTFSQCFNRHRRKRPCDTVVAH